MGRQGNRTARWQEGKRADNKTAKQRNCKNASLVKGLNKQQRQVFMKVIYIFIHIILISTMLKTTFENKYYSFESTSLALRRHLSTFTASTFSSLLRTPHHRI